MDNNNNYNQNNNYPNDRYNQNQYDNYPNDRYDRYNQYYHNNNNGKVYSKENKKTLLFVDIICGIFGLIGILCTMGKYTRNNIPNKEYEESLMNILNFHMAFVITNICLGIVSEFIGLASILQLIFKGYAFIRWIIMTVDICEYRKIEKEKLDFNTFKPKF